MLQHGTETEMEAKARKWKGNWSRGICIFVAPTPDTKPSTLPTPFQPPTRNWTDIFDHENENMCELLSASTPAPLLFFLARLRNMLAVRVCVCVCGFVKSASVISVRLNGAKQTWAKNSDRKRPQRGPKKCSSWTCFMWVLCRARERQR